MKEGDRSADFESVVLPHLDAAYNLARWVLRDGEAARDVVQDAVVRALRFFGGYRGGDARRWLLAIVRNACYSRLRSARPAELEVSFDEEVHGLEAGGRGAEATVLRAASALSLEQALERLPVALRETVVLRELEGLSYADIAAVTDVPIGTVMSRLSRSRRRLQKLLSESDGKEG